MDFRFLSLKTDYSLEIRNCLGLLHLKLGNLCKRPQFQAQVLDGGPQPFQALAQSDGYRNRQIPFLLRGGLFSSTHRHPPPPLTAGLEEWEKKRQDRDRRGLQEREIHIACSSRGYLEIERQDVQRLQAPICLSPIISIIVM
uniref:Uncharacterized protein n=1 Tax=Nelumbo nucifera TaxID=4432 RepID=A0A822Z4L4_NELNU|nr:TPA_asm: hypothetical protein HUJ06_013893 [Nelumbo nucifera]